MSLASFAELAAQSGQYLVSDLRALRRLRNLREEDEGDGQDQQDRNDESLKRSHGGWYVFGSQSGCVVYMAQLRHERFGGSF
jgi:hypothetical protein